ncbi:MAG: TnsA endonuclease N-terminal domain-containing protein [Candidatus Methylacidiphilales bacterium]|nr:TnsA endonuclease N-terminal domain-containing protein [Candidatus Methylacidiphilales bacterium]
MKQSSTNPSVNVPARRITKSHTSLTGFIVAGKAGGSVAFESRLERDYFIQLDFDPAVRSFAAQPLKIQYTGRDGKQHSYTPDVLVQYSKSPWGNRGPKTDLVEIKSDADLARKSGLYEERFKAAAEYAAKRGWKFSVLRERDIQTDFNRNAFFLWGFRRHREHRPHTAIVRAAIRRLNSTTVGQLLDEAILLHETRHGLPGSFEDPDMVKATYLATIWKQLSSGYIEADLNKALHNRTEVWVSAGHSQRPRSGLISFDHE